MFNGIYHSIIGASHTAKGTVCQDWSAFQANENYAIAVVADGHGSKKHFRSDIGSKLAVAATLDAVHDFYADVELFEKCLESAPKAVIRKLEKNIISRWNTAVKLHFDAHPVTEEEKSPFTEEEFTAIRRESIYGTTLIACILGREFTFGIQIGDGSLVVLDEDCEADMPIIEDDSTPANLTASMCNSGAIDLFNSFFMPDRALAVFCSTDGLYTSFRSTEDFLDYHTIIASHLDKASAFDMVVKRNLAKRTHFGTQDDISLSVAFDQEELLADVPKLKEQVERNKFRAEIRKAEHKAKIEKQRMKNIMRQRAIGGDDDEE